MILRSEWVIFGEVSRYEECKGEVWWRDGVAVDGDAKAVILEIDGCRLEIRWERGFSASNHVDDAQHCWRLS